MDIFFCILAAVFGAALAPVPAVLCAYLIGVPFYPLFVVAPLLIYFFNKLVRGTRSYFAVAVNIVFSLASAYITAIACQAALFISYTGMPLGSIFRLTFEAFGRSGVLPSSASAYAYPLVFTLLGICAAWELLRVKRPASDGDEVDSDAEPDAEADAEAETPDGEEADLDAEPDAEPETETPDGEEADPDAEPDAEPDADLDSDPETETPDGDNDSNKNENERPD